MPADPLFGLPARVEARAQAASLDLPIVPTTAREFGPNESITAIARVFQTAADIPGSIDVRARILDRRNVEVFSGSDRLPAEAFAERKSADYRLELPLQTIGSGLYLLSITASASGRTDRRDVVFRVR
jgi:hypothetical protein